jgi:hypothetical protein
VKKKNREKIEYELKENNLEKIEVKKSLKICVKHSSFSLLLYRISESKLI